MAAFLFTIYLIACCYFITRIKFVKDSGLAGQAIIVLFLVKVAAGLSLGLVNHFLLHNTSDYDLYNGLGIVEYHNLFADPHLFFTDIFHSNYSDNGEFFGSSHSYWNDLRTGIIFKVLGFMNIFSRGNYYINSLFFNFFCFFGHIAFYRVFIHIYPKAKLPVIIGCFLIPSMLYFSSGIHKDPIVFTALGIFCYSLYFSLDCGFSRKRMFFLLLSLITILLIRNFIAVFLLPAAFCWFISRRYRLHAVKVFLCAALIAAGGVVWLHSASTKFDPLQIAVNKQQAFLEIGAGRTLYKNDTLAPTIKSFLQSAPRALGHAYLTPYPGEFNYILTNLFSVEVCGYCLLLLLWLFSAGRRRIRENEFVVFAFCFTFLIFLFTGYITTAAGALIRYRSIYLPLIITPLLAGINWSSFYKRKEINSYYNK